jgi:signal transduction histidine kinase/tetratricopeptide (TPR) repeat protein
MSVFKRDRTSRLRAIRAYLLLVLFFSLLLFASSVVSFHQQSQEISSSNLSFKGEQMALDIERRVARKANECLSPGNLNEFRDLPYGEPSLDKLRFYRERFAALRRKYPVAEHFFVFDGNRLEFPLLEAPAFRNPDSLAPRPFTRLIRQYMDRLSEAKSMESLPGKALQAAALYGKAESLPVPQRLKAIALYHAARVLEKSGSKAGALESFQRLLRLYGDQYDESQNPYILTLAISPENWSQRIFESSPRSLYDVYLDLVDGRWELSEGQAELFMSRLERSLELNPANRKPSDFLASLQLAKAVKDDLEIGKPGDPFATSTQFFQYNDKPYQIYFTSLPPDRGRKLTIGFSVSISWLKDSVIPSYPQKSPYASIDSASLITTPELGDKRNTENEVYASFRSILPYWKLQVRGESAEISEARKATRELWFIGMSIFMFLSILGLGLFFYIRVSWDIRWFQLRSDFVSGVSHEFKTPLSLIRLYSETLAGNEHDFSPEDRRNYIRIIARESERLSRLIDNVLDYSKMEQRPRRPLLPEGDLTATISQAVQDYSEYLLWRGFDLKSSIQPLPPVRFNPEQVLQIILNLLDNARKYSGASRLIRLSAWARVSEVIVEVQDNGIGIPAEEKDKIFQPFYRIASADEKGGCGLGLYLVAQVMKEHGGRVEVESEVNRGSLFRLVFPVSGRLKTRPQTRMQRIFGAILDKRQAQDMS